MTVYWPDNAKQAFGTEILRADHPFDESNLFSDDGLAHLLDRYPRQSLDIWTFGENREGENPALRGRAPRMSGKDIVDAVKNGRVWLNLRRANLELPELKPIADDIFGSLETATGRRTLKQDMGLLISSPRVHVHYHLDIPMVALFQLRGRKRLWLYPTDPEFAPPEYIEQIVHMTREEDLPYRNAFDDRARVFDLKPGHGFDLAAARSAPRTERELRECLAVLRVYDHGQSDQCECDLYQCVPAPKSAPFTKSQERRWSGHSR